jgi:zinc transport system permease protein
MLAATILSLLYMVGGLAVSYQPDFPAGATTIVIAGAVYLIVLVGRPILRRARSKRTFVKPGGTSG